MPNHGITLFRDVLRRLSPVEVDNNFQTLLEKFVGSAGAIGKRTQADLFADLNHPADTPAFVVLDPDTAKDGIYIKSGASGAGSWELSNDDRLGVLGGRATTLEGRATAIEAAATALSGRTTTVEGRATAIEAAAVTLTGRTTTVEGRATTLEGRATDIEAAATTLSGRTTIVEGRATAIEAAATTLTGRTTTVEGRATAIEAAAVTLTGRATSLEASRTIFQRGGKNLFNSAQATAVTLTSAGTTTASGTRSTSDFMPVSALIGANLYCTQYRFHCQYDANKAFIAGTYYDNGALAARTFSLDSSAAYVRITVNNAQLETTQIEYGTVATSYESYRHKVMTPAGAELFAYKGLNPSDASVAAAAALEGRATALEGRATGVEGRATAIETAATALTGRATILEHRALGAAIELDAPNLVAVDWRSTTLGAVGVVPVPTIKNGISAIQINTGVRRVSVLRSAIAGSTFDASAVIAGKDAGDGARLLIMQRNGEAEIVGARQTYTPTTAAIPTPIIVSFTAVAIDAACTSIEIYFDSGAANVYWAMPMIAAASGNAAWRKTQTEAATLAAITANTAANAVNNTAIAALNIAASRPNLLPDPLFTNLNNLVGTALTAVVEILAGVPSLKIIGTTRTISLPRNLIPGSVVSASVAIPQRTAGAGCRVLLQQFTDSGEIMAVRQSYNVADAALGPLPVLFNNIAIDATCTSVKMLLDPGASTCWFNLPCIAAGAVGDYRPPELYAKQVYVATTGLDSNPGTIALPFRTIAHAQSVIKGSGTIIIRGGDYTESIDLTLAKSLRVFAYPLERVRLILGTLLTGITKTGGYTKVYQAALTAAPLGKHIFEHGTPEGLIPAAERHSLQRGRSHRLPSTRIWQVASIAAVDAATRPSWFWSAGIIYFSAADLGDATTKTYYSTGGTTATGCAGGTAATNIEIEGIESWYPYIGFSFANCGRYKATALFAFGSASNGIVGHDSSGEEIYCETAATGNDGCGSTGTMLGSVATARESFYVKTSPWNHDNYDDGDSLHERCNGTYLGGLIEYNGDKGLDPAAGAHVRAYNVYSRFNGQNTRGGAGTGQGFAAVLDAPVEEGGIGTQMECFNCISEGDNQGFSAEGANTTLRAFGCKTINAGVAAYYADAGVVYLQDCGDSGSATVKSTATGGTIVVANTAIVS